MKYAKKMIMVPEVEYLTLLNMIKGDDYLKTEKSEINTEMSKVLRDPKLSEDSKARKYNWLLKQRRQLQNEINRPQQVQIDPEQLQTLQTPKYLGVEATTPQTALQQQSSKMKKKKKTLQNVPYGEEEFQQQLSSQRQLPFQDISPFQSTLPYKFLFQKPLIPSIYYKDYEDSFTPQKSSSRQQEKTTEKRRSKSETTSQILNQLKTEEHQQESIISKQYIIHPKHYDDYIKILKQNDKKYKIDKKTGSILDEKDTPITGSNFKDLLDYLTGKRLEPPVGSRDLYPRIKDEKWFKTALEWAEDYRQKGEGKRQHKKYTKGLVRAKKVFKPIIWERI